MSTQTIQLVDPNPYMEQAFWDFCGVFNDIKQIDGLGMMRHAKDIGFKESVTQSLLCREPEHADQNWVPQSTYWLTNDNQQIIGTIDLRHTLKGDLKIWGGHIGYSVHPNHRRQGHATFMLKQLLPIARHLGLTRLLITCYENNESSNGVIKNSGGIFESLVQVDSQSQLVERWWINLT
ncbi:GNAT family N-acetyltransferase [Planctomycetota bacterium]|nr:GNAT family N-acetyltransferase [Planctomycetota bacterium]